MSSPLRSRLALPEPIATVALLVLATACAALLFAQERRVAPRELPSLTLPEAPVARVIHADARAAATAPASPHAQALAALLLEHGRAQARGPEQVQSYRERRDRLERGYRELVAELGEAHALRLREKAVAKLEAALALELGDAEAKAVLGSFPAALAREGASRNGELVAPHFVVRTLYKARWNLLHGLVPDHRFERVEKRAYYGWQALHAERVPLPRRVEALHAYGLAGGNDIEEALGVLLLRKGELEQAVNALQAAYRNDGNIRLRNALLAARHTAGFAD